MKSRDRFTLWLLKLAKLKVKGARLFIQRLSDSACDTIMAVFESEDVLFSDKVYNQIGAGAFRKRFYRKRNTTFFSKLHKKKPKLNESIKLNLLRKQWKEKESQVTTKNINGIFRSHREFVIHQYGYEIFCNILQYYKDIEQHSQFNAEEIQILRVIGFKV